MLIETEYKKIQELSQCIDSLNEGQQPIVQDQDIKELVEVASLIKNSYVEKELPRMLIDEIVDQLATEFEKKRKEKPMYWRYKKMIGAVAALVIATFTHFLLPATIEPDVPQSQIALVEEQANVLISEADHPPALKEATILQTAPEEKTTSPGPTPVEEKSPMGASLLLAEIIDEAIVPEIVEKPNQVAMLQEENPQYMAERDSVSMKKAMRTSLPQEKNNQLESKKTRMLVLPNHTPQSVIVEAGSGDIKQVYQFPNHETILITQEGEGKRETNSQGARLLTRQLEDKKNRLRLQIDKYTITIEGEKTTEELRKIGETLIEEEQELKE